MILTSLITITINSIETIVKNNLSVFEVCKNAGFFLPRFCYHELLQIAGNCRMCLIEISNSPKPVAACVFPIVNNMKIFLNTPLVLKARENVLESLLLNHPLDCPICDQGGECDLQDQIETFGFDYSRFFFPKREVEDKQLHPYIIAIMTRCIHCTRCIRFSTNVLGVQNLGLLNRGNTTSIGNYNNSTFLNSNLATNIVDLCPVGALTAKSHNLAFRAWKAISIKSLDLSDGLGSNIYIKFKNGIFDRIIPKINNEINDNLITDRSRMFFDSLKTEFFNTCFYNGKPIKTNNLIGNKFTFLNDKNNLSKNIFIIDEKISLNTLYLLKKITPLNKIRLLKNINYKTNFFISDFSNKIISLNKQINTIFIIATNLEFEAALLNAKLRIKFNTQGIQIYSLLGINSPSITNFINLNLNKFINILEGKQKKICKIIINTNKSFFILGENITNRGFKLELILKFFKTILPSINYLNLYKNCNTVGIKTNGIQTISTHELLQSSNIFFLNLQKSLQIYKICKNNNLKNLIWLNALNPSLFLKKNINNIIPIKHSFFEKNIYINLEQRPQETNNLPTEINIKYNLNFLISYLFNQKNKSLFKDQLNDTLVNKPFIFNNFKRKFLKNDIIISSKQSNNLISNYPMKLIVQ